MLKKEAWLLAGLLVVVNGCKSLGEQSRPAASAPRTCQDIRGAYCIESVGLTVHLQSSSSTKSELLIYEQAWRSTPIRIVEPATCTQSLSDTVEALDFDADPAESRIRVRLAKNGSCDLDIFVGGRRSDPAGNGFFTAMTQLRACRARPCTGPVIGGIIRQKLKW
jgi:hypothetical protein